MHAFISPMIKVLVLRVHAVSIGGSVGMSVSMSVRLCLCSPRKRLTCCNRNLGCNLSVLDVEHLLGPSIQGLSQADDFLVGIVVVEDDSHARRSLGYNGEVNRVGTVLGHLEMEDEK